MLIRARNPEPSVGIDLTPVIDMVFLLLIFFLVATTFHQTEREMKIALPAADNAGPITAVLREIVINVDETGKVVVGGQIISDDALHTLIADAIKVNAEQKVTVRGDRRTAYANIVRVLDVCKGAGVQEPYLDTVLEQ